MIADPALAIAAIVAGVLAGLSLLHVYWCMVGISGRSIALPEIDGRPTFQPSRLASFAVAVALGLAAWLVAAQGGFVPPVVSPQVTRLGVIAVGVVFLLRAVGDFRLVGFFKRIRGTPFARWDTRLFSPLCLALGLGCLWLAVR
ncbi:MAG: DUF3995 domain-containing protein [Thermoanaerobaculia bacterium]|nr:DUF3995 domain-containing protein [Thermoanaerobaculia bacterium]